MEKCVRLTIFYENNLIKYTENDKIFKSETEYSKFLVYKIYILAQCSLQNTRYKRRSPLGYPDASKTFT